MVKSYWMRWAAKAEQRAKDRKNAKQFEVAGEMLTFVQPSVDAKLSYAEAMLSESAADTGTRLRKPDL